jgi:hypothetical protein
MAVQIRPLKFFLPAAFLFVLGLGNILVGHYKEWQYTQVYEELSVQTPTPKLPSVVGRIQAVPQVQDRHMLRQIEANERRNLYRLVAFGGKAFMSFSIVLLSLGALALYAQTER